MKRILSLFALTLVCISGVLAQETAKPEVFKEEDKKINPMGLELHVYQDLPYEESHFAVFIPKGTPVFENEMVESLTMGGGAQAFHDSFSSAIILEKEDVLRHHLTRQWLSDPPKEGVKVWDIRYTAVSQSETGTIRSTVRAQIRFKLAPVFETFENIDKITNPNGLKVQAFQDLEYGKAYFELVIPAGLPGFKRVEVYITSITGLPPYLLNLPGRIGEDVKEKAGVASVRPERCQNFILSDLFLGTSKETKMSLKIVATDDNGVVSMVPFGMRFK